MVSAPTGRVCKKNARAVHVTTEIRIVIRSAVAPSSNASSVPFSTSCRCTWPACCCISCPSFRSPTHNSFYRAQLFPLFVSFFRTTSLRRRRFASHPGAECDTRRSFVNDEKHDGKKVACVASCHRLNQNFHLCVKKEAARICPIIFRDECQALELRYLKILLVNILNLDWSLITVTSISKWKHFDQIYYIFRINCTHQGKYIFPVNIFYRSK